MNHISVHDVRHNNDVCYNALFGLVCSAGLWRQVATHSQFHSSC